MINGTEENNYLSKNIETLTVEQMVYLIHLEDIRAYDAITSQMGNISRAIKLILRAIKSGGRAIYIGAGTSGRVAAQDVIELKPTYGLDEKYFLYLISGGKEALQKSVENVEDDLAQAEMDLNSIKLTPFDVLIGVTASGNTPYVIAALRYGRKINCNTICITNNIKTEACKLSKVKIELQTGPEIVQGSTRMKAGTAQKMVLNIISTTVAVKLGRTYKNTMSSMGSWFNSKLRKRALNLLIDQFGLSEGKAEDILVANNYDISKAIRSLSSK